MNKEAQNIAIAKTQGWWKASQSYYKTKTADIVSREGGLHTPPDYLSDLNAMHAAEAFLDELEKEQYANELYKIVKADDKLITVFSRQNRDVFIVAHATAQQRADAFCKTLGIYKAELLQ